MKAFINNKEISLSDLSYNDGLNFNRFFDSNILSYSLIVTKNTFIKSLEKEYNRIKDEIQLDDLQYNELSDFSEINYCSFEKLLDNPEYLLNIFKDFLRNDFFKMLSENSNSKFVINSIDSVENAKEITIKGRAFIKK
ncbi:hypothetical protein [Polaribacter gangjinensis]|uniref:Uncharacterized protein n=1 Tax=Polaribacter gangjinensis TaxID=574710 RepID=A0A2S7WE18_9FLAO|nr:hypothetical protein [Polaribacter gangjinensis]PQJ75521.1 hypothetical protein BTO13_09900 [Polaribacter gangjinensis]